MTDNIDHILVKINTIIEKNPRIHKGILFGSRAMGTERRWSDIDIAICGDVSHREMIQLGVAYDVLALPYRVDFIAYDTIKNQALREHIDRVGKVLIER
jgi:uncharacterized protein